MSDAACPRVWTHQLWHCSHESHLHSPETLVSNSSSIFQRFHCDLLSASVLNGNWGKLISLYLSSIYERLCLSSAVEDGSQLRECSFFSLKRSQKLRQKICWSLFWLQIRSFAARRTGCSDLKKSQKCSKLSEWASRFNKYLCLVETFLQKVKGKLWNLWKNTFFNTLT